MSDNVKTLTDLMADLEEDELLKAVNQRLAQHENPLSILTECREGVRIVGERFEKGDYFVADLIMSGEVFENILNILRPSLSSAKGGSSAGKVVFGTVKGDIHNIGKDVVISQLEAGGFEVFDLGINVPEEKFVQKVKETGANIVGLSGLITISYDGMKTTVEALAQHGLRDRVKVMIGGGLVNSEVCKYAGADAWGEDAVAAVNICRRFIKELKR
jgi:methanogenic corrinoid protein MtbC1